MNYVKHSWLIRVGGQQVKIKEGSLSCELNANGVSMLSFIAQTQTVDRIAYKDGAYVEFEFTEEGKLPRTIFGGVIAKATLRDVPHTGVRYHRIQCVDNYYFADKRLVAKSYVDYTNEYWLGDIVTDLFNSYFVAEGITIGNIEAGTKVPAMSFNYIKLSEAMDKLAERAGYEWYIDAQRRLYFQPAEMDTSGVTYTYSDMQVGSLRLETSKKDYRNTQIVKGATATTDVQTQTFTLHDKKGVAGEPITLLLGYKLADKPTIKVNGVDVDASEIAIRGSGDILDAKIEYSKGSEQLTIKANFLDQFTSASDLLTVEYRGTFPVVLALPNPAEVDRIKAVEGGTGVVENVLIENGIDDLLQAFDVANENLKKYSKENYAVHFDTDVLKADAGSVCDFEILQELTANEGLGFVVESIHISDEFDILWFSYKCVKGNAHKSWQTILNKGLTPQPLYEKAEVIEQETVVVSAPVLEHTFDYYTPHNYLRHLKVGANRDDNGTPLKCSTNLQVSSIQRHKRVYVIDVDYEVDGVTYTDRVRRASERDELDMANKRLTSIFQIPTYLANGTIKTIRFYGGDNADEKTVGTGYLLGTISDLNIVKTRLTIVNVYRVDNKNW